MNNWKVSLDRYLTSPPEDNFTPFVERVYELLPDNTWQAMERTGFTDSESENAFLSECCFADLAPELTAFYLIILFHKLKEKGLILRSKYWEDGKLNFKEDSKLIHERAQHLGKFYANNLYLLT